MCAKLFSIRRHDYCTHTAALREGGIAMILKFAIQTVFDIVAVVLIIYGFIHEDKLIAFEDSLKHRIKKKGAERHARDNGNRS